MLGLGADLEADGDHEASAVSSPSSFWPLPPLPHGSQWALQLLVLLSLLCFVLSHTLARSHSFNPALLELAIGTISIPIPRGMRSRGRDLDLE